MGEPTKSPRETTVPDIAEFKMATVVRMPCCGFGMAFEHIDTFETDDELMSKTWTCPLCERTYGVDDAGHQLVEHEKGVTDA